MLSDRAPSTVFDEDGLPDAFERAIAQRTLNAETDRHLSAEAADGGNRRSGDG